MQLAMASLSSAVSAPIRREGPSARAAHSRARLVMLLDPGTRTVASTGCASGSTGRTSAVLVPTVGYPSIRSEGR